MQYLPCLQNTARYASRRKMIRRFAPVNGSAVAVNKTLKMPLLGLVPLGSCAENVWKLQGRLERVAG